MPPAHIKPSNAMGTFKNRLRQCSELIEDCRHIRSAGCGKTNRYDRSNHILPTIDDPSLTGTDSRAGQLKTRVNSPDTRFLTPFCNGLMRF